MAKRFLSIWFPYLTTDWFTIRQPELRNASFVLKAPDHGRDLVVAANAIAQQKGIEKGMPLADARAIFPGLVALDQKDGLAEQILTRMAAWCIRFTPVAAADPPDGLLLDISGCAHLWGGDRPYITDIYKRFKQQGYTVRMSMADTVGAAWAVARFAKSGFIVEQGKQTEALLQLPPAALRLETETTERLNKLGLRHIHQFIAMPRQALFRRFGPAFILRLQQALGETEENIIAIEPAPVFQERLPCLEPITTATGIEIALQRLLETICKRLQHEQQGLRKAVFKGYCTDGKITQVEIGTHRPSSNEAHLFKLFAIRLPEMAPGNGIELFILDAPATEHCLPSQKQLWSGAATLEDNRLSELLDRIAGKIGNGFIQRYLPDQHYWPERSFKAATSLQEPVQGDWYADKPRPVQLLSVPERIEVTAPIPDYPPMLFRYKGKLHTIHKAEGPERIEQEWWLQQGQHRDYYTVEDQDGQRYWLFRLGHYDAEKTYQWFIHGFFA